MQDNVIAFLMSPSDESNDTFRVDVHFDNKEQMYTALQEIKNSDPYNLLALPCKGGFFLVRPRLILTASPPYKIINTSKES